MGQNPALEAATIIVLIIVAGLVAIAALIINAVVRVKVAKYASLQASRPADAAPESRGGVWPPPPAPPNR